MVNNSMNIFKSRNIAMNMNKSESFLGSSFIGIGMEKYDLKY